MLLLTRRSAFADRFVFIENLAKSINLCYTYDDLSRVTNTERSEYGNEVLLDTKLNFPPTFLTPAIESNKILC